jgi:dolichyl-phosphate-mannose-protein mannosyltransferase
MTPESPRASAWTPGQIALVIVGVLAAIAFRLVLFPKSGLTSDIDQFVLWTHGLATRPFGNAYDQNISFPPVMVYIWGVLAAIEPGFRTAIDSSDDHIRLLMKLPATLADVGLAVGVWYALRDRPKWAVVAALAILLHPAVFDVSAWWGQYESIYALVGLIAFLLATRGHPGWAAVALGVALMTKPQALPFAVPFAAWYLAKYGLARSIGYGAITAATVALLWAPFLSAGGPGNYLHNLAEYQNDLYAILSLRAWNVWWIVQSTIGGEAFVSDTTPIVGPVTFRLLGYAFAGLLELVVFLAVLRSATPRNLALGLAASALVAFSLLTTMHERYAFAALVFLAVLLPDTRARWTWIAFGIAFTLNLLAATPPTEEVKQALPIWGPVGIVGSAVVLGSMVATLVMLTRRQGERYGATATGRAPILETGASS